MVRNLLDVPGSLVCLTNDEEASLRVSELIGQEAMKCPKGVQ